MNARQGPGGWYITNNDAVESWLSQTQQQWHYETKYEIDIVFECVAVSEL